MSTVETFRGPVEPEKLGATLMHEHIFSLNHEVQAEYPDPEWDEERMVEIAVAGLDELRAKGIDTVVDLTVPGIGRGIPLIQRIAERVETNLVAATGYYTMRDLPPFHKTRGPGKLVDVPDNLPIFFRRDVEEGIAGTGVKAGIIKVVTDEPGLTPDVTRVLAAAAEVQLATGVPISTHTNAKFQTGREQQQFFRNAGVPLERVIIGHSGDSDDLDYLKELLDNGSSLGLDRFGMEFVLPDEKRVDTLMRLLDLGYAEQLTLSHDASYYSANSPPSWRSRNAPNWVHTNVSDRILPQLRERGVSEETITTLMVGNPARLLQRA